MNINIVIDNENKYMCSKAMSRTEVKWNDEQQQQQLLNERTIAWVIIQINKLSIQYSVRYWIIPIYE